jgi:hypothetical protein
MKLSVRMLTLIGRDQLGSNIYYPNNLPIKGRSYGTIEIDRGGNFR